MRAIERTKQFKRDYKRESRGRHRASLDDDLVPVVKALAQDAPLENRRRDDALNAVGADHRECHLWPDSLLKSRKLDVGASNGPCTDSVP
ncbi:MAG: type II toxin-antitoxin system mRNA interferase toxin, RelE/StbE family [Acidobacteriia bacterium]|nr:type II toxin-antitoxin system mRNA interferase toxin, RelE/StbE family [Terriglobia bacterium]MYG04661.1 type II toxin-antitoxin system mRNA interferase toxin, RelE/StbE family [Terriglobia bacterium]MYK09718.1 type II toxin-antitoxin system mRNA interferase toxin, RelE/StbE family [Terriglobia bacterium]